jgi:hypothetical protein
MATGSQEYALAYQQYYLEQMMSGGTPVSFDVFMQMIAPPATSTTGTTTQPKPPTVQTVNGENFQWIEPIPDYPGYPGTGTAGYWQSLGNAPASATQGVSPDYAAQLAEQKRQFDLQYALDQQRYGQGATLSATDKTSADQWQQQFGYNQSQDAASAAQWQQQFDYQKQQDAADQAYRQQQVQIEKDKSLAQLRANPASWLQYSLEAGQTPVVQPWMLPLSPQEYGLKAGMAIPGWQGLSKPMDAVNAIPVSSGTPPVTTGSGTSGVATTPTYTTPPQLSRTSDPTQQRAAIDQVIAGGNFPDPAVRDQMATQWQTNYQNAIKNPVVAPAPAPPATEYQPPPLDPTQIYLPPRYEQFAGYANGTNGPLPYPQQAIVGEQGPELAYLQAGSSVTPLNQTNDQYASTYPALTQGQLPWLMSPSRQYQARMSPSSYGQYQGYQQMATGAIPDDTNWMLYNMAPPSGANVGLRYRR